MCNGCTIVEEISSALGMMLSVSRDMSNRLVQSPLSYVSMAATGRYLHTRIVARPAQLRQPMRNIGLTFPKSFQHAR